MIIEFFMYFCIKLTLLMIIEIAINVQSIAKAAIFNEIMSMRFINIISITE